jgi:hypothetical protein
LKMRDLVVTTLLKSIGDPNAGICVTAGDTKVNSDLYKGAELIIAPSGRHSAESPRGKALTI